MVAMAKGDLIVKENYMMAVNKKICPITPP
jgi:hypothetical protein